jgi:hypothetical protein
VKEINHDDERLAALLGGRLEGAEREELLAHLLANDEDYQVFADTAAILQEAEEEEAAQVQQAGEQVDPHPPVRDTLPPSVRGGWRRWKAPRVIVPAVLAGLVVFGIFSWPGRGGSLEDPVRVAASLEEGLPAGWTGNRPWSGMRGDAESGAAQAGALLVDLAVSIQAEDSATTALLARTLRERFDLPAAPDSPIMQIEARAGDPASELQPLLAEVVDRLEDRPGRDYLRLGAWTEAARLAAGTGDAEFFRARTTTATLARAEKMTRENAAAQTAIAAIRSQLETGAEPSSLSDPLDQLMKAIAS